MVCHASQAVKALQRLRVCPYSTPENRWHSCDMSTQTDPPCSAADRDAIIKAANDRRGFIKWLSECISSPRWDVMSPDGQAMIRAEVRLVLDQMVEGCS